MQVLGLGGSQHDYCACLVEDGNVVSAVEEERLTRVKTAFGLGPRLQRCLAAGYVLTEAGLTLGDVDLVVANDFLNRVYSVRFGDRVTWISHHLSHAASTFYTSPFESAAVMVMDGRGSSVVSGGVLHGETVTTYLGTPAGLSVVDRQIGKMTLTDSRSEDPFEDSVGWMYEIVSKSIGFVSGRTGKAEPGKTMGLAPYGSPAFVEAVAGSYSLVDGKFRQSTEQQLALRDLIAGELGRAGSDRVREEIRADFAYAVQASTENIMLEVARRLHRRTGQRRLCLAGGVALNSVANFKILQETPFEEIHIVPAAGDSGTALGAALHGYHAIGGNEWKPSPVPFSPYLGRTYSTDEVERAVLECGAGVSVERPADLADRVAAILAGEAVVGWFQGRSEIGPRALGNRSILADPRRAGMKDRINAKVKHREPFRPFAPIVLAHRQGEYFSSTVPAPYMLLVPDVRPEKRAVIPAVTHVDGSARLQTVLPELNPRLHALLTAFDRLTGVPVLLNTSFNDNNEPIVETPADAVRCFLSTEMDALVLGDLVVRKASAT